MNYATPDPYRDTTSTEPSAFDRLVNPAAWDRYRAGLGWSEWVGPRLVTS